MVVHMAALFGGACAGAVAAQGAPALSDDAVMARLAQAAAGNRAIESEFIQTARRAQQHAPPAPKNRFYNVGDARDGAGLAQAVHWLGQIGTRRSLSVACEYLRSPLKTYVPNHRETSVRYAVVDALRDHYPDLRLLDSVETRDDWRAVERFCTATFGTRFAGPTPELPRDNVYPHLPR